MTRGRLITAMGLVLITLGLIGGLCLPYRIGKALGQQIRPPAPSQSNRRPYRSE